MCPPCSVILVTGVAAAAGTVTHATAWIVTLSRANGHWAIGPRTTRPHASRARAPGGFPRTGLEATSPEPFLSAGERRLPWRSSRKAYPAPPAASRIDARAFFSTSIEIAIILSLCHEVAAGHEIGAPEFSHHGKLLLERVNDVSESKRRHDVRRRRLSGPPPTSRRAG